MSVTRPVMLIILDGLGAASSRDTTRKLYRNTMPFFSQLLTSYPATMLSASGAAVGLSTGYVGNSEVGHLTIGSGCIVNQPLARINNSISDGTFFTQQKLVQSLKKLRKNQTLHIMGLLSDAGVHAHIEHIIACIKAAQQQRVANIVIHAFLDGRDVPQKSARGYLEILESCLHGTVIGSVHGRLYAMDRDKNWDRTQKSYTTLTDTDQKISHTNWQRALDYYYAHNITDEHITPTLLTPDGIIKAGDGVIFCNFRPDRARQLTAAFIDGKDVPFNPKPVPLSFFITPTSYSNNLVTTTLLEPPVIRTTLKNILSDHNKRIVSIAETEKYAHVTYFFDGYREEPFANETRILIPSHKTISFDHTPKMRAREITDAAIEKLRNNRTDFYLINYANADMVGHTGNYAATTTALACLDAQLARLVEAVQKTGALVLITADHGNAEQVLIAGSDITHAGHTCAQVPCIVLDTASHQKNFPSLTQLTDIAPFILQQLKLPIPPEMIRDT